MSESVFVSADELSIIQRLNDDFNKTKLRIADLEIEKQMIFKTMDGLRSEFAAHEKVLIEKYGPDSVINLKTGEVTQKTK